MTIAAALAKAGIATMADLDAYRNAHIKTDAQGRRYIDSRYHTLRDLIGERAADHIMQELALQQCMPGPAKKGAR